MSLLSIVRPRVPLHHLSGIRAFGTVPSHQILNRLDPGHDIKTIDSTSRLQSAASALIKKQTSYLMVVANDEEIIGFLTERDCIRAITEDSVGGRDIPISELMTPIAKMGTVKQGIPSEDLFKIMLTNNIRHLPICDDQFVIRNVVSIKDVAKNIVVDSME